MKRKFTWYLCFALWVLLPVQSFAQERVTLGGQSFVPPDNVSLRKQQELGVATHGKHNVLLQFTTLPKATELESLRRQGVVLEDYLGGKAYYATINEGSKLSPLAKFNVRSVVPVQSSWKIHPNLQNNTIPTYARTATGLVKIVLHYAANISGTEVRNLLQAEGYKVRSVSELFRLAELEVSSSDFTRLASFPWTNALRLVDAPSTLWNQHGARLSGAAVLKRPTIAGGYDLRGRGQKIGIWDGNVVWHPDFDNRVHVQEYELADGNEAHGTHVAGTVLGSGLLNASMQGMAPAAEAYTYNFNRQSNGLYAPEEMRIAREKFGIGFTQNSYGITIQPFCAYLNEFFYSSQDYMLDQLAVDEPYLTHVFAAGNDQSHCSSETEALWGTSGYGTVTTRAKNVLYVAATDGEGRLGSFSSCGPQGDGRLSPLIAAKGTEVWSTWTGPSYQSETGTSMACPTVTGTLALLAERFAQLNNGEEMRSDLVRALCTNTADDAGRKGPDFQYGYGLLNATKAVKAIEQAYFAYGVAETGKEFTQSITVPKGSSGVRAMLAWNDPTAIKDYAWDERVLQNDLDLRIEVNGKSYEPWILTPTKGHVTDEAKRGDDNRNNIEQVTLTKAELTGVETLTLHVRNKGVASGKQNFAITWWFDSEEGKILTPAVGDIYTPAQTMYLHLQDITAPYTVEISYDNGKTFNTLKKVETQRSHLEIQIPKNAPLTNEAKVCVVDKNGNVTYSEGVFTIAPSPTNLQLKTPSCGRSGWQLSWNTIPLARQGYEVLVWDARKHEYTSIGKTENADANVFTIPENKIPTGNTVYFAVAIRVKDTYVARSEAIRADVPQTLKITKETLPFAENFKKRGSDYFITQGGKNTHVGYKIVTFDAPVGSNVFRMGVQKINNAFDESDYFDMTKNADNVSRLTFCNIDLTAFAPNEKLQFRLHGSLALNNKDLLTTSRFRIWDNNALIKDIRGAEEQIGTARVEDWVYLLEGGKTHSLVLEHAGKGPSDEISLRGIYIEPIDATTNVSLQQLRPMKDAFKLGKEKVEILLSNRTSRPVTNCDIRVYVNDKWVSTYPVKELKGYERKPLFIPVDFSSPNPFGEAFTVRMEVLVAEDNYPADNKLEFSVRNLGDVVVHPISYVIPAADGGVVPIPYFEKRIVGSPFIYTDNGGGGATYKTNQISTIQFIPKDPDKRLRITFKEFDLVGDSTYLTIWTNGGTEIAHVKEVPYVAQLRNKEGVGRSFVSDAPDGALTLFFRAGEEKTAAGWIAEIDFVPVANPISLLKATAQKIGTEDNAELPITVTLRNNFRDALKDVTVSVFDTEKKEFVTEQKISSLPTGEKTITLDKKLQLPLGSILDCKVLVRVDGDSEGSDNQLPLLAAYDRYCIPGPIKDFTSFYVKRMRVNDSLFTLEYSRAHILYELAPTIPIYKDDGMVKVELGIDGKREPGLLTKVWVDWNQNGVFDESESQSAPILFSPNVTLNFPIPAEAVPGKIRVRVAVGTMDEMNEGPCFAKGLTKGDYHDVTFEMEAHNPANGDLALTRLWAGKSGATLGANQEIKLKIRNMGNVPYKTKLKVRAKIDGGAEQNDEIDFSASPLNGQEEREMTLPNLKADWSALGRHTLIAAIEEQPTMVNAKNNQAGLEVHHLHPNTLPTQYALDFRNGEKKSFLNLSALSSKLNAYKENDSRNFECLFNASESQFGRIIGSKGFNVILSKGLDGIPDDRIVVYIGANMLAYTKEAVVKFKQWQHLVVSTTITKAATWEHAGRTTVNIFVDGEEKEVLTLGVGVPNFTNLVAGDSFIGMLDELRVHNMSPIELALSIGNTINEHRTATGDPDEIFAQFRFEEGPSNTATIADGDYAASLNSTITDYITKPTGGFWLNHTEAMIADCRFEGQVDVQREGNEWTVKFHQSMAGKLNTVSGSVVTAWDDAKIKVNGADFVAGQSFDFSNPINIEVTRTFFGQELKQKVTLKSVLDESDACDILSLQILKTHNADLAADYAHTTQLAQKQTLLLTGANASFKKFSDVRCALVLSPEAIAYLGEVDNAHKFENNVTAIDFTKPVHIIVKAKNGTERRYDLRLCVEQTIAPFAMQNAVYGDAAKELQGASSANLPLRYVASDPTVASIVGNKISFLRAGKCQITALQDGTVNIAPTSFTTEEFVVAKKNIVVKPAVGEKIDYFAYLSNWKFEYSGLVKASDVKTMPLQLAKAAFLFEDANGNQYDLNTLLPAGKYKLVKKANYETPSYIVEPQSSQVEIVYEKFVSLRFVVKAGANDVTQDAHFVVDNQTDVVYNGRVIVDVGAPISYKITWDGLSVEGEYTPTSGAENVLEINLPTPFTLTYNAGTNGSISGATIQKVAPACLGEAVLVVPATGYRFKQWSDGQKDNPRQDKRVTSDISVTAEYESESYTLTYEVVGAGLWKSGKKEQEVARGSNAEPVEVAPATANAIFMGWSDGVTTLARTESNLEANKHLIAYFTVERTLPEINNFESGLWAEGWLGISQGEPKREWDITRVLEVPEYKLDNFFALCDNREINDVTTDYFAYIYTPFYNVSTITNDIGVAFDYALADDFLSSEKFVLEYSFDGKTWTRLQNEIPTTQKREEKTYILAKTLFVGKAERVQFRWKFHGQRGFFVLLDNIAIFEKNDSQTIKIQFAVEPSDAGDVILTLPVIGDIKTIEQELACGEKLTPVTAKAKLGYRFLKWSNGIQSPRLTVNEPLTTPTTFTALFARANEHFISYSVSPAQGGKITKNGTPVSLQIVEDGHDAAPVTAEANAGYEFAYWSLDGSTNRVREDKALKGDLRLIAVFELRRSPIHFSVTSGGAPVENVNIIVGGRLLTTDANGKTQIEVAAGEYVYLASHPDYSALQGKCKHGDQATEVTIELLPKTLALYDVIFSIIDEAKKPIVGAKVEIGTETFTADAWGGFMFSCKEGRYQYTVSAEGYKSVEDAFLVEKKTQGVTVTLKKAETPTPPGAAIDQQLEGIAVMPNPFTSQFRIVNKALSDAKYELFNVNGVVVSAGMLQGEETVVNTTNLGTGMYLLRITHAKGTAKTYRVIKQ